MWLWVVVAVAAAVHAAVIDENENRRIRDAKDEIFNKYTRLRQTLKKERSSGYPLFLSFLLSGILAFMFVKLSVFVGLHYQILLVLCHTGKERKCLHHGFNPDFPGVKKIAGYILRLSPQICNESSFAGELSIPSMVIKFIMLISFNHRISFFWRQVRKEIKCTD